MSALNYSTETLDRIKKIERIRALGVNPYATKYDLSHQIGQIISLYPSNIDPTIQDSNTPRLRSIEEIIPAPTRDITIAGRIMLHRSFGKICFATISDGTAKIQILFSRENCQINVNGVSCAELVSSLPPEKGESEGVLPHEPKQTPPNLPFSGEGLQPFSAYKFAEKLLDLGDFIGVRGELFYTHK